MLAIAVVTARKSCGPTFHSNQDEAYKGEIPAERHKAMTKKVQKTNYIERFNNTLRQRVSHLVCETLLFSKKLASHLGAINYYIYYSNRARATALPIYVAIPG